MAVVIAAVMEVAEVMCVVVLIMLVVELAVGWLVDIIKSVDINNDGS
jgi:hypothetical protein